MAQFLPRLPYGDPNSNPIFIIYLSQVFIDIYNKICYYMENLKITNSLYTMNIETLISQLHIENDPGASAGRGATITDLDSKKLNDIADQILKHYGQGAHDSYVKMVWAMGKMSATAFLLNLYSLFNKNWDLAQVKITNKDSYVENEDQAFALFASVITSLNKVKTDDTDMIRKDFRKQ